MTKTVSGIYATYDVAASTVRELEAAGFTGDNIAIVTNTPNVPSHKLANLDVPEYSPDLRQERIHDAENEGGVGALLGGTAGLLAGMGLLVIPGVGPLLAGGWLVSTALGAALGGAGGLAGALVHNGHLDEHAAEYAEAVRQGATLVSVKVADDKMALAQGILSIRSVDRFPLEVVV